MNFRMQSKSQFVSHFIPSYVSFSSIDHPEPPSNLELLHFSNNSVTLQWKPGFNGGLKQRFRIRYADHTYNSSLRMALYIIILISWCKSSFMLFGTKQKSSVGLFTHTGSHDVKQHRHLLSFYLSFFFILHIIFPLMPHKIKFCNKTKSSL